MTVSMVRSVLWVRYGGYGGYGGCVPLHQPYRGNLAGIKNKGKRD